MSHWLSKWGEKNKSAVIEESLCPGFRVIKIIHQLHSPKGIQVYYGKLIILSYESCETSGYANWCNCYLHFNTFRYQG